MKRTEKHERKEAPATLPCKNETSKPKLEKKKKTNNIDKSGKDTL